MLSNVRTRTSVFHTHNYKLWNTDCSNVRESLKLSAFLTIDIFFITLQEMLVLMLTIS